ncbi:hypothetical protein [Streptomyces sp. NPDC006971]|uniref:hypothetical protein n=1 Tax=Streptomyces sp. NPDC006971 TaxID=3154784 RepID=UPI0033EF9D6E
MIEDQSELMGTTQQYGDLELSFGMAESEGMAGSNLYTYTFTNDYTKPVDRLSSGHKLGPKGRTAEVGVVLKDLSSGLLRPPASWEKIADVPTSSPYPYAVWRPIPPEGYVALGDIIARSDYTTSGLPEWAVWTACVKKAPHNGRSYVRRGECGAMVAQADFDTESAKTELIGFITALVLSTTAITLCSPQGTKDYVEGRRPSTPRLPPESADSPGAGPYLPPR